MKAFVILPAALAALTLSTQAMAQDACTPAATPARPTVSVSPLPPEPPKPACAEKGNCSKADATKYNDALAVYNTAVDARNSQVAIANAYMKALAQYTDQVQAYTTCERQAMTLIVNGPKS